MKKLLLGATALTMVAGGAAAQEWNARVGGFAVVGLSYIASDDNPVGTAGVEPHETEVDILNTAEVTFNFNLVADNGITFGYKVEMEAYDGSIDENVASISGSFGTVQLGVEDGAHDNLIGTPAGVTAFTGSGDAAGNLFDSDLYGEFAIDTDGSETGDSMKITYYTPSFSGFRAGISYAPNDTNENGPDLPSTDFRRTLADGSFTDAIEIGAAYSGDFGGFSVAAGAGATFFSESPTEDQSYGGSLNVGFGGFTVGGRIAFEDKVGGREDDGGYALGANYETGPWNFGLQYAQGMDASEDRYGISLGADYALAPGVTTGVALEYAADDTDDQDAEGTAIGAFLALNF